METGTQLIFMDQTTGIIKIWSTIALFEFAEICLQSFEFDFRGGGKEGSSTFSLNSYLNTLLKILVHVVYYPSRTPNSPPLRHINIPIKNFQLRMLIKRLKKHIKNRIEIRQIVAKSLTRNHSNLCINNIKKKSENKL